MKLSLSAQRVVKNGCVFTRRITR